MNDMVGEFLLDIVFSIVSGFLSLLPDTFQWSFEPGILGSFLSIILLSNFLNLSVKNQTAFLTISSLNPKCLKIMI